MKRYILFTLLLLSALFTLTGCQVNAMPATNALTALAHTMSAADKVLTYEYTSIDSKEYETCLYNYGLTDEQIASITDFAIARADGIAADEYVILYAKSNDISSIKDTLTEYKEDKLTNYIGYAPEEEAKIRNCVLEQNQCSIILFIGGNAKECRDLFLDTQHASYKASEQDISTYSMLYDAVKGISSPSEASAEQTEDTSSDADDAVVATDSATDSTIEATTELQLVEEIKGQIPVYDSLAILEAYRTKDSSLLTDPMEQAVLSTCEDVINALITDDMSDYEKEKAIHDYIVVHTNYDANALEHEGFYTPYADQPYGTLINGTSICIGYASTFQLFMDMLDIECVTIIGTANLDRGDHAWNAVMLDGNWYMVDVTWDDPIHKNPDNISYKYFNVSNNVMKSSNHHWDEDAYPKALESYKAD